MASPPSTSTSSERDGDRTPSARSSAETRAAVYDVARRRLNRYGFAGMTYRHIAREVGIEPQSIYNYAPSKADLVVALMTQGTRSVASKVEAAVEAAPPDATSRLRAATRARVEHYLDGRELVDVQAGLTHLDEERRARVVGLLKEHEGLFKQLVADGVATGEFRPVDVSITSFAILGLAPSVTTWHVPNGRLSIEEICEQYAELAVRMVRAQDMDETPSGGGAP